MGNLFYEDTIVAQYIFNHPAEEAEAEHNQYT